MKLDEDGNIVKDKLVDADDGSGAGSCSKIKYKKYLNLPKWTRLPTKNEVAQCLERTTGATYSDVALHVRRLWKRANCSPRALDGVKALVNGVYSKRHNLMDGDELFDVCQMEFGRKRNFNQKFYNDQLGPRLLMIDESSKIKKAETEEDDTVKSEYCDFDAAISDDQDYEDAMTEDPLTEENLTEDHLSEELFAKVKEDEKDEVDVDNDYNSHFNSVFATDDKYSNFCRDHQNGQCIEKISLLKKKYADFHRLAVREITLLKESKGCNDKSVPSLLENEVNRLRSENERLEEQLESVRSLVCDKERLHKSRMKTIGETLADYVSAGANEIHDKVTALSETLFVEGREEVSDDDNDDDNNDDNNHDHDDDDVLLEEDYKFQPDNSATAAQSKHRNILPSGERLKDQCDICFTTAHISDPYSHLMRHKTHFRFDDNFSCPCCDSRAVPLGNVNSHILREHREFGRRLCVLCLDFHSADDIGHHWRKEHHNPISWQMVDNSSDKSQNLYKCDHCQRYATTFGNLLFHVVYNCRGQDRDIKRRPRDCNLCGMSVPEQHVVSHRSSHEKLVNLDQNYTCKVCQTPVPLRKYNAHLEAVHGSATDKRICVGGCNVWLEDERHMRAHWLSKHADVLFMCNYNLSSHVKQPNHAEIPDYKLKSGGTCKVCLMQMNSDELPIHLNGHVSDASLDTGTVDCHCGTTISLRKINSHLSESHSNGERRRICVKCYRSLPNATMLHIHLLEAHGGGDICERCDRCFVDKANLGSHASHCSVIKGRKLKVKQAFMCEHCGKTYQKVKLLETHVISKHRDMHPSKEKKSFVCQHCASVLWSRSSLSTHEFKHTGIQPFKCLKCDYLGSGKDLIVAHMRQRHKKTIAFADVIILPEEYKKYKEFKAKFWATSKS
jgi:hypothetical protein